MLSAIQLCLSVLVVCSMAVEVDKSVTIPDEEAELQKMVDEMDLTPMLDVPFDSSPVDVFADLPPSMKPIPLQYHDNRPSHPREHPDFSALPRSIQKLHEKYGWDIPHDIKKKVWEQWFYPARGELKHRAARKWGMEKIDVFALHDDSLQ